MAYSNSIPSFIGIAYGGSATLNIGAGTSIYASRTLNKVILWCAAWSGAIGAATHYLIGNNVNAIWNIFQPALGPWLMPGIAESGMATYWGRSANRPRSRPITAPAIPLVYG